MFFRHIAIPDDAELWWRQDAESLNHHKDQFYYWLSRLQGIPETDNHTVNALAMAHLHCSKANELEAELARWMPGGHEIR